MSSDPIPRTSTDLLLAQVRDELRTLNTRLGGGDPSPVPAPSAAPLEEPATSGGKPARPAGKPRKKAARKKSARKG